MKRLSRNVVGMLIMLILLLLVLVGIYAVGMRYYSTHFFSGATINGVDVSGMTVDEAKYQVQDRIREYSLTCYERNSQIEEITGSQIYMQYVDDGRVDELMKEQNAFLWPFAFLGGGKHYSADIGFTYDKNTIEMVMDQMRCFQTEFIVTPTGAHIESDGTKYYVTEPNEGAQLNYDATRDAIMQAIEAGETEIDFEALDLYLHPRQTEDIASLQAKADEMNQLMDTNIYYDFVDRTYTIDGETMVSFIKEDDNGEMQLDEEAVAQWVYDMAYETDTFGMSHQFVTSSGREITLAYGGDYGWCINQEQTTADLLEAIRSGYQGELEPTYLYKGVDRSSNDIGDTYVEVCIEDQRMWCYKDGVLIADTPVVTGNHSRGLDTPSGHVWAIDSMKPDFHISNVDVDYWIAFYGNCGIHDSSWRKKYGGEIWKTNGSHGCVNTPKDAVEDIFNALYPGFCQADQQRWPIIVYYSEDQPVGPEPTQPIRMG